MASTLFQWNVAWIMSWSSSSLRFWCGERAVCYAQSVWSSKSTRWQTLKSRSSFDPIFSKEKSSRPKPNFLRQESPTRVHLWLGVSWYLNQFLDPRWVLGLNAKAAVSVCLSPDFLETCEAPFSTWAWRPLLSLHHPLPYLESSVPNARCSSCNSGWKGSFLRANPQLSNSSYAADFLSAPEERTYKSIAKLMWSTLDRQLRLPKGNF